MGQCLSSDAQKNATKGGAQHISSDTRPNGNGTLPSTSAQTAQRPSGQNDAPSSQQQHQAHHNGSTADGSARERELSLQLVETQQQVQRLQNAVSTLQRRLSQVAPSNPVPIQPRSGAESSVGTSTASRDAVEALHALREHNPDTRLSVSWQSQAEERAWEGVRWEDGQVTGLALSNMQIVVLPPSISSLTSITTLMLSGNQLTAIPAAVGLLTSLTTLLLDSNKLRALPDELGCLVKLQTLWLQDNELAALPGSVGQLTSLRQLLASRNRLTSVPACLSDLTSLHSLWLDSNHISVLPMGMTTLTQLKRLRVDPHVLPTLHPEIAKLATTPAASSATTSDPAHSSGGTTTSS
uniref:Disease resistance R13L4/SHOC-2-like LRR domain-containing protein n=1 Tax=Chlamydomonas leiostraca TaxID=1034604 RepID=A0A7S0RT92_9CHLO